MLILLAGCGVSNQAHQTVISQLADAKHSLDKINSTLGLVANSDRDYESNLASLHTRLNDLKDKNAELTGQIAKLKAQEDFVFQSAGGKIDAKDFQGALEAYKEFIDKYPSSHRIATATNLIARLEQTLKTNRR